MQMVAAADAMVTRASIAPGVHAGSGNPPWLTQPDVFVRGAGVHAETIRAGAGTVAASTGAVVEATRGGGAVGTTAMSVGVAVVGTAGTNAAAGADTGGVAAVQAVNTSTAARIMQRTSTGVVWGRMERIDVTSGRPPSVDRPEGSKTLFLTFDGLRNAKVRDKDTRIRITLQGPLAARLWRLLGERLTDEEKAAN